MISVIFEDRVAFDEARRQRRRAAGRGSRASSPQACAAAAGPRLRSRPGRSSGTRSKGRAWTWAGSAPIQDWYVRPQLGAVPAWPRCRASAASPRVPGRASIPDGSRRCGSRSTRSSRRSPRPTRPPAGTSSPRATPSTSSAASAGWAHRAGRATPASIPSRPCATWSTSSCRPRRRASVRLADVARVSIAPGYRRGVLEKDGNEVTGGVVLMAHGENPLEVTRRLKAKIRELQAGLPPGVQDRPLLRPHAADRGRDRHRHRHGRRGDDLGQPVRPGGPAALPHVVRHRGHAAARGARLVR